MYGLRLLRQRPVQLAAIVVVLLVVLALRALQFAALTNEIQWGYDFSFYWTAARNLIEGDPIYSAAQLAGPYAPQGQDGFLYPPPLAAAMIPLATLFPTDYRAANWVWASIGALLVLVSIRSLWRSERIDERYPILAGRGKWLLVGAAFAFPPVVGELVMGNVHFLLLWLLTLAWLGIRRGDPSDLGGPGGDSRGGAWRGGAMIGVAAMIKIFPGILLLWAFVRGSAKTAVGILLGAALTMLLTLPITGKAPWLDYPTVLANLSAPTDTTDTLAPTVWLAGWLDFTLARIVITAIGLAIIAWSAWTLRHAKRNLTADEAQAATARSFAIAVTVSVLIAPAMYHHYLALLVLPLLLGLGAGVPLRYLAPAYFLMWGGQQDALGDLSWVINRGLPTLGALVLLAGLILTVPGRSSSLATSPAPPGPA
ncbi:MAG: glycosyltransferase family 87 protein [Thermoleophilaceae bacterium]